MELLVLGLAAMLGIHMIPSFGGLQRALEERFTENIYKIVFSIVSLVGLTLIIYGYDQARYEDYAPLYVPPYWTRHLVMLLMVPVFPLLMAAYFQGNIKRIVKHPMILSIKIWAFSHLLTNGEPQSVLLFGSFLLWAVFLRIRAKGRPVTYKIPEIPSQVLRNDVLAIVFGLLLYGLFVWKLHGILVGVPLSG
ncbi:hypothetical protein E1162_10315 [Rhodobacteraceae bacterium RKSG542]|uniref:NnrU family protein n=1 Tax=Pseudovibrio flavus TaxID=2529854 RepID=UPI0012BB4B54|nr:NnrU family protein [Pseudovibrio flavus]MTI17633.1 hypothetical protein [Pseudovibrio flavus]